jgi:dinuclear metal center YbgI/SA1388 family protein
VKLKSLLQYTDEYLRTRGHPDYPTALNGLQVDGPDTVSTIATAVDASLASIEAAADLGADLMIVHHGLFWGGLEPIVGRHQRRIAALLQSNIALYSSHLPLDGHAEIGNCALLGRAIGLNLEGRLGSYKGQDIGWWGTLPHPTTVDVLSRLVSEATGGSPVRALPGGPATVESVGVLTGGGGSFIAEAAAQGLDAFVTGEGSHHSFFDSTEYGIHVLFAGHYATETFGVRALGEHLAERFDLAVTFLDLPTGL